MTTIGGLAMEGSSVVERPAGAHTIREASDGDADQCGRIFYGAFRSIAVRHNLPVEPSSPEFTRFKVGEMMASPGFAALVAERDGEVVGSAFADERSPIVGIGPVTVDPATQDRGVGRALMEALLARETGRDAAGIRLVQTAYHYRSLALYAKLGFTVREPLSVIQGDPPRVSVPGLGVRAAEHDDIDACGRLCVRVHGHERRQELQDAITAGTAVVIERPARITGYATGLGYGWHAVAETNEDLIALLGAAEAYVGLGVLVPSRNAELLRWCLANGLRVVQQSTLMTIGLYNEPSGPWLPSILF
jgi:GNAT superfamily N-acetyltransferase